MGCTCENKCDWCKNINSHPIVDFTEEWIIVNGFKLKYCEATNKIIKSEYRSIGRGLGLNKNGRLIFQRECDGLLEICSNYNIIDNE